MVTFRELEILLQTESVQNIIQNLTSDDVTTDLIRSALKQSAHVINTDKSALAYQLAGRLGYYQDKIPEIKHFLAEINPPQHTLYPLQGDFDALMPASNLIEWILPHHGWIRGLKQLADGQFLSWSDSKHDYPNASPDTSESIIYLCDKHGVVQKSIIKHPNHFTDIHQLPNGLFLTRARDNIIRLWDKQWHLVNILEGHTARISNIVVLSNGEFISCSEDTTLRLWDGNGQLISTLIGHVGYVEDVIELTNGNLLSWSVGDVTHTDQTIRIWGKNGALHTTISDVVGVIQLQTGHLFSWSDDNTWYVWDTDGTFTTISHQQDFSILLVSSLEHGGFATYLADGSIHIWDGHYKHQATLSKKIADLKGFRHTFSIYILPNNRFITRFTSTKLELWDTDGTWIKYLDGHEDDILGTRILSDGCILTWSGDRNIESVDVGLCLWDGDGNLLKKYYVHSDNIRYVLELDDNRFISWGADDKICLWNRNGDIIPYRRPHRVGVCVLAPLDNKYFFSEAYDSKIIWDENLHIVEKNTTKSRSDFILSHNRIGDFENLAEQRFMFMLDTSPKTLSTRWMVSAKYDSLLVTDSETNQVIHRFRLDGLISRFMVVDDRVIVGDWLGRVVFLRWIT